MSSNAGSLPEVLGEAAVLLPPVGPDAAGQWANTIARLLGDEPARIRMAAAGRAQAARFTWEKAAAATLAAYREALAR